MPCAVAAQHNSPGSQSLASAPSDRGDSPGASGSIGGSRGGSRGHSTASRTAALRAAYSNSDLRSVPGIGPKNEQLLVARGHPSLDALRQHFSEDVRGDTAAMAKYLNMDVGIRMKYHCEMIAAHLLQLQREAAEHSAKPLPVPGKKLTLCVEGNISAGKSSFLRMLTQDITLHEMVEMVPEPVDQWQNVGGKGGNMLEQFYSDPQRYAYTFQNYVFITRVMQEQQSQQLQAGGQRRTQRLIERSVFSDRMVFVRAVHNAKWMSELELQVYDSWFNPIVSALPTVVPDGFIYLRATPETCLTRLERRSRSEEGGVSLDYLTELHEMHEQWLRRPDSVYGSKQALLQEMGRSTAQEQLHFPEGFGATELGQLLQVDSLKVHNLQNLTPTLFDAGLDVLSAPPGIEQQVYFLDRTHQQFMHPSANRIPVLVLDYDQDIDLEKDVESRAAYAKQISTYFQWVKQLQEKRLSWQKQLLAEAEALALAPDLGTSPASSAAIIEQLRRQQQSMQMATA